MYCAFEYILFHYRGYFISSTVPDLVQELLTATAAKSRQSCPTLSDPLDGSPTGSSVPGILQARILQWVAIPFRGSF